MKLILEVHFADWKSEEDVKKVIDLVDEGAPRLAGGTLTRYEVTKRQIFVDRDSKK